MTSRSILTAILLFVASPLLAQPGKPQIVFQADYASAIQAAKKTGLPLMLVVATREGKPPESITDHKVIRLSQAMINVGALPDSQVAKKQGVSPGEVVFLNEAGEQHGKLESGFTAEQLLEKMTAVIGDYRTKALETLKNDQEAAATQKIAANALSRLGADIPVLISLLGHKSPDVKVSVRKMLLAREAEGADWALLKAMGSADSEIRAVCYPVAVDITKATKTAPPLAFWKDAPEAERSAALEKWREASYGKLPPLNKAVLDFAFENYGKQVGSGECSNLVEKAFKEAKAQPIKFVGKTYTWGSPIPPGETAIPGDVVQLEEARFSNGISASHHTQVIRRVLGPGQYEVLEQNFAGRRTVGLGKLNVKLLTSGTVVIFRPLPIKDGKQ